MKKKLVLLAFAAFLLFGGVGEFQKTDVQTQPEVMTPLKDEYPEIIPGG